VYQVIGIFFCVWNSSEMISTISRSLIRSATSTSQIAARSFHISFPARGFEEFYDPPLSKNEVLVTGRSWTAADLRRKVTPSVLIA
jgi:hypothetical protein